MYKLNKNIILHFHVFKNAGTTIDWILKKNFGDDAKELTNPDHDATINMNLLQYYFQLHKSAKSLSSHQFRFPMPEVPDIHLIPMVFIRHPIDRIYSVYNHFHRWHENHIFYKKAKELNLKEFVEWYLNSDDYAISNNATMKNAQVVFLSNTLDLSKISSRELETAMQNIKSCEIFGLVERLDESLCIAENILQNYFNNIDLSYKWQNVNHNRLDSLEGRIELFKNEVGIELFDKIIQNNKLDLQLYQEAEAEFEKRAQRSKDLKLHLSDFLKRCTNIQANIS